jgi:hypothetical protein
MVVREWFLENKHVWMLRAYEFWRATARHLPLRLQEDQLLKL